MVFLKRVNFIIFMSLLGALSVFFVSKVYYMEWFVAYIIYFLIIIVLSFRVIESGMARKKFLDIVDQYRKIVKLEDELRTESLKLELVCPDCQS